MIGRVQITRRRGRIAGYSKPRVPVEVLWCGTNRPRKKFGKRADGWSFPPAVREILLQMCKGRTVLHLFGGKADFGARMDLDPATKPLVVADAWLPPFRRDSFDVVILDPPYFQIRQQEKIDLLRSAGWIARQHVIWFHSIWIASDRTMPLERAWLLRVGDQCAARVLQVFRVTSAKRPACGRFSRGPALKYNRWLNGGAVPLSFDFAAIEHLPAAATAAIATNQARARGGQIAPAPNSPGGVLLSAGEQRKGRHR